MFKNEKLVKMGRPVVFKDGKKVDMSAVSDQWIDGDILQEEMQYIAKMTEGLTTGTMSGDKDYIELKNKVVKDMISDKVVSLKRRLCQTAKKKSTIYDHASEIQKKTLEAYHSYAQQVAKDNTIEIYFDEMTGEYKINRSPVPISLRNSSTNRSSSQWHTIDAKMLKEEMKKRGEGIGESRKNKPDRTSSRILKEVEEKLKAQESDKERVEKLAKKIAKVTNTKKKARRKKAAKKIIVDNKNKPIYDLLELSKYKTYESIPAGKKSWITIHAKRQGKDSEHVKSKIKIRMLRAAKKTKK